jgi:hypothetical protein
MSTNNSRYTFTQANNYAWRPIAAIVVLGIWLGIVAFQSIGQNENSLLPPATFKLAATVDLSTRSYDDHQLATLAFDEPTTLSILFTAQNVATDYLDLRLVAQSDDTLVILRSEKYRTDHDGGGLWEQFVTPGEYRLMLTAIKGSGLFTVYWDGR